MNRMAVADKLTILGTGTLYGLGFALAGFTSPASMKSFLDLALTVTGKWNAAPAVALGMALFVAMIGIRIGQRMKRPVIGRRFEWPAGDLINARLFVGALLFGVGWGLAGFVPVTALAALFVMPYEAALFLIGVAIGIVLVDMVVERDGHAAPGV